MSGGGPKPRIPVHYDVAPPEPPAVPPSLRALYPRGLTVEWVGWPLRLQEQTQDRVDILEVVVPIAFANGFNKVIIRDRQHKTTMINNGGVKERWVIGDHITVDFQTAAQAAMGPPAALSPAHIWVTVAAPAGAGVPVAIPPGAPAPFVDDADTAADDRAANPPPGLKYSLTARGNGNDGQPLPNPEFYAVRQVGGGVIDPAPVPAPNLRIGALVAGGLANVQNDPKAHKQ